MGKNLIHRLLPHRGIAVTVRVLALLTAFTAACAGDFAAPFGFAVKVHAQAAADWTEPFPPFRIAGNLYYVGSRGLANYLVTTPQGHILINSDLDANVPLIRASVEKLGFKFTDIKILLISHAHWDHNAASAAIKRLTGAKYMVMEPDVAVVESGGKADFQYGHVPESLYAPTSVDRALRDGDEVRLGDTVLVAHLTPGHTKGCTTWTMKVQDDGKSYDVVIVGSPNVNPGYRLVNNDAYPRIAADYERTFRVLKSLPCDIFLGAHGSYFDLERKYARLNTNGVAAFVDPAGYKSYVAERESAFRAELAKQRNSQRSPADRAIDFLVRVLDFELVEDLPSRTNGGRSWPAGVISPGIRRSNHAATIHSRTSVSHAIGDACRLNTPGAVVRPDGTMSLELLMAECINITSNRLPPLRA